MKSQGKINVKLMHSRARLPTKATNGAAAFDLYCTDSHTVYPGMNKLVPTGIAMEIPEGHVGLLAIRSGMSKIGITLANGVGKVDSDYRGEIIVNVLNTNGGGSGQYIRAGERIAQLTIVPAPHFDLVEVDELSDTERGEGGFGSTGK